MNRKVIWIFICFFMVIFAIFMCYAADNPQLLNNDANRTVLNVSSEGPISLSKISEDIKTSLYYKGYDNDTLKWMESLGDKYVFISEGELVIMDKHDADKIPSAYVNDAFFNEIFSCNVLENHSLGSFKYHKKDVLLVENVEFLDEEIYFLQ